MEADNFKNQNSMFSGELSEESTRIKIIGVGGAGTNAVDRLQLDRSGSVKLAAINTDAQALASSPLPEKLMIGRKVTRGLSTGGESELGKKAAEGDADAIRNLLRGMDLIFLLVGLGGGTGSGAASVVAKLAAEEGALVIAFVTLPFTIEGAKRHQQAEDALGDLRKTCDAVIPLPNDLLMQMLDDKATVLDAFAQADIWIDRGVRSICTMLSQTGLINLDFATLRKAFCNQGGKTLFGLGHGEGEDCVAAAIEDLKSCPLLNLPEYARKADRLLVNIVGGTDLGIRQVNEIMSVVTEQFGSRENTILGAVIDESLQNTVEICVIGTTDVAGSRYVRQVTRKSAPAPAATPAFEDEEPEEPLLRTASATQTVHPVHRSKLKKTVGADGIESQEEFLFVSEEEQRGYFEKTERNLYEGEDLDVPTYLRRGVRIPV
ncbi:cell division protein FtsZ [Ruficoccus amylovorans]|uniref:Cell division protein FtsZ n=1 Tax=Ruficoccus amylovorans TaxID=1804625 RepID=A0A842HIF8_9BACT|nr:cell division protein FtsZ [Ruficoccus amylovorans]MBC2595376.1 cell division protein FtsZ [Ruficoccus amylovorans]